MRMNVRKEKARIIPLTQPAFWRKETKKENLVCLMWSNLTFITLDGETETAETIEEANMTAGLL